MTARLDTAARRLVDLLPAPELGARWTPDLIPAKIVATDGATVDVIEDGGTTTTPGVTVLGRPGEVGTTCWLLSFGDGDRLALGVGAGPWNTPTLANGWAAVVNYPTRYRRVGDQVEVQGIVKDGTSATMWTLPLGFRPVGRDAGPFAVYAVSGGGSNIREAANVVVKPTGVVQALSGSVNPVHASGGGQCGVNFTFSTLALT